MLSICHWPIFGLNWSRSLWLNIESWCLWRGVEVINLGLTSRGRLILIIYWDRKSRGRLKLILSRIRLSRRRRKELLVSNIRDIFFFRLPSGLISKWTRTSNTFFIPQDLFCPPWNLFLVLSAEHASHVSLYPRIIIIYQVLEEEEEEEAAAS